MSVTRLADLTDAAELTRIEEFLAQNDESTVFHRPDWLNAVALGTRNKALGLITERASALTGWLPVIDISSPFFGRALVSSGFGVSGGIIAETLEDAQALSEAVQHLAQRRHATSVELRGGKMPTGWERVEGKHANFSAELCDDDEAQLAWIKRHARAEVRKSLSRALTVTHGTDAFHRAAHYAVYSESLRNLGTPAFPRSLFENVMDRFGNAAEITLVQDCGEPVAAVLSLYHKETVMPFWGGGKWIARSLHASERMYYELMCHARRRGCTRFDFGRSKTGSGPYKFKKNWGFEADPLAYFRWHRDGTKPRNIDPTDHKYAARIAIWQRLPLPIANRVGPLIARGLG